MPLQVDFVGYINNPFYGRGRPPGEARRQAVKLQQQRLTLGLDKQGAEAAKAERVQKRMAAGGVVLPARYKRVVIRGQSGVRFEEFDFSFYNRTRFAGLENDLPNCYCNALLQVRSSGRK
jgi:PAB-dependent poly(A)-specific ribonuclease subunit 2